MKRRLIKADEIGKSVRISGKECFHCGCYLHDKNKSTHHAIPQHLNPERNIIIPVCLDCHKEVHDFDSKKLDDKIYSIECKFGSLLDKFEEFKKLLGKIK